MQGVYLPVPAPWNALPGDGCIAYFPGSSLNDTFEESLPESPGLKLLLSSLPFPPYLGLLSWIWLSSFNFYIMRLNTVYFTYWSGLSTLPCQNISLMTVEIFVLVTEMPGM